MEDNEKKGLAAGWILLGAAAGVVATMLVWRKMKAGPNPFDVDSVLGACDKAAAKLECLIGQESRVRQTG